jgi:hypothetical protein
MIGRRAAAGGIATKLGNHSFRATGITAYLKNGGTLEKAAQMANHASTRTTQLYDRQREELSLDEVADQGVIAGDAATTNSGACQRPPVACVAALTPAGSYAPKRSMNRWIALCMKSWLPARWAIVMVQ